MNINIVSDTVTLNITSAYELDLSGLQDFLQSLVADYEEIEWEDEAEEETEEETEEEAEEAAV
jgi:hypothetical protein